MRDRMAPQRAASVFEPFMQADSSTTRRYGGTGLGLSISRRLIALMNGRIEMESEPGRGTCFRAFVTLPVTADRIGHRRSAEERILPAKRSLRILLAEDNGINQKVTNLLLRKMGHEVDVVADGGQAVVAVVMDIYDLALMDCQMPVMDGYAATRTIRQLNVFSRIPIIAMTPKTAGDARKRAWTIM
jgi:CheY-like chemotaxis protein